LDLKRQASDNENVVTTWVDLDIRDGDTTGWIERESGLSKEVAQRLLERNELSRREIMDGGLLICFHTQKISARAGETGSISLRIWIEKDRVITVRSESLPACEALHSAAAEGSGSWAPFEILAFLTSSNLRLMEELISDALVHIGDLEDEVLAAEEDSVSEALDELRRKTIRARRHLVILRNLLVFITSDQSLALSKGEQRALEAATNHVRNYLDCLEDCHERAHLLQDQVEARMAARLNRITYNLTIVATVFLPLGFLTGLLGMNVAGIPDEHNPWGFFIVCVVMIVIAGGSWLFFRWRRWI
jgi:zinc transporter